MFCCIDGQANVAQIDYTGAFSDPFYGQTLHLCQDGNEVHGSYKGGFVRAALNGDTLTGFWHDAGADPEMNWGAMMLKVNDNDDAQGRLEGWWSYGEDGARYRWETRRLSYATPSAAQCMYESGAGSATLSGAWEQTGDAVPAEKKAGSAWWCTRDDSSIMRGSATGWWRDGKKQRIGFGGVTGDFGQTFQGMWAVGQKQYGDYLARAYSSTAYSAHYWDGRLANYPDPEVRYLGMEEGQKKDKQPGAGGLKGKCKEVTFRQVLLNTSE